MPDVANVAEAARTASREPFALSAQSTWEELGGGVRRQMLGYLPDLMMVRVDFTAGAIGAMHQHPHRQATYVAAGRFRVTIGASVQELGAGDCFITVPDVQHGVVALEAGTLVDVFTPLRADFLAAAR